MNLELTPAENFVITDADRAQARGANELKACPFCGRWAYTAGIFYPKTGNTVYSAQCTSCHVALHVCQRDAAQARREVVEKWNTRVAP